MPLQPIARTPESRLQQAVHRQGGGLGAGMLERLFTTVFKGLVYPQIWEDPKIDLDALELRPGASLITIASGGCNVLSYLTAEPERIIAVDLNRTHRPDPAEAHGRPPRADLRRLLPVLR